MSNSTYWAKRFEALEQSQSKQGLETYQDVEKQFRQAQRTIETQISAWYQRFAENNHITLQEAKKLLTTKELEEFKWDVEDYIQYGKENKVSGEWEKQLENASARYHISRLDSLKVQLQQSIEKAFGNELDAVDDMIRSVYKEGYYKTIFEIQKGVSIGSDFAQLDETKISKLMSKPWASDGKNFSSRIWSNKDKLVNELNTTLTQNIMLGRDPQKAIDEIARKMKVSKNQAGALVMTEQAFFSSAAQKDAFNELDVEKYEIVATLDLKTSNICQEMDKKVFPMKDYVVGTTAPPFHVRCRTTTCPYFDDDFGLVGERAARGEDGKTYYVPADMTYKEWKETYVDGGLTGNDDGGIIKKIISADEGLQEQLSYEYYGQEKFIPVNAKFTSTPKVIAGSGSKTKIRQIKSLTDKYGGNEEDWSKKVAKIESDKFIFDIHWYQRDDVQYLMKLKQRSEKQ